MARRDVLSARANEFLEANQCASEYSLDRLNEEAARLPIRLSELQIETVANLWRVAYSSRSSFQDRRYRVAFFDAFPTENVRDFLERRSYPFATGEGSIIADVDTDETHGPDGLVMDPSGALGVPDSPEQITVFYRSAYMVVERDALLEATGADYAGVILLKPLVSVVDVEATLGGVILYPQASDECNAMWYSDDAVFLYQGWFNFHDRILQLPITCGAALRVFGRGRGSGVFADAVLRMEDMVYMATEARR